MFSDSIDCKINKIKANFDNYLSDRRSVQPPIPSVRRPEGPSTHNAHIAPIAASMPQHPTQPAGSVPKPIELQIKQMIMQGKTYDKAPLVIKNVPREKTITIGYQQQQIKLKLQIKVMDNNLDIKINTQKSTVQIAFKRATRYKFVKPESGQPMWMTMNNDIKDDKILLLINKEGKMIKSCFEMVPDEMVKVDEGKEEKVAEDGEKVEVQDVPDDVINFMMPSAQQFQDTQKFRRALKDMKEEQKSMIMMDIFKIKKEYDDPSIDRRRLKCPIYNCQKQYRQISQLKTHLRKHEGLNRHGIELTDYGTFEFSQKSMDLALFLGKLFPFEMKKIIKKMKSKQNVE